MTYQVNEIFVSIQGEGVLTGSPATFIRLQGCSVGCPWCDSGPLADSIKDRRTNGQTHNTWGPGGERMSAVDIASRITTDHVVITGGEPTLYNLDELLLAIWNIRPKPFIQLETSGQQWLKGSYAVNWITWSPKEMLGWNAPDKYLMQANEVKWVVDEHLQLGTVTSTWSRIYKARYDDHFSIYEMPYFVFMPEGCPPNQKMIDKALEMAFRMPSDSHMKVRFGDRLQYRIGVR
jgi:7-carboxy-7-deazaguanine synthase